LYTPNVQYAQAYNICYGLGANNTYTSVINFKNALKAAVQEKINSLGIGTRTIKCIEIYETNFTSILCDNAYLSLNLIRLKVSHCGGNIINN
jgi:hypothetical protein